jgi:transcriptional regulator with GAF, ATPase, and Fis domain
MERRPTPSSRGDASRFDRRAEGVTSPAVTEYLNQPITPLKDTIRAALVNALDRADGCQKDAARLLAISPRKLNYMLKQLGLRDQDSLTKRAKASDQADQ